MRTSSSMDGMKYRRAYVKPRLTTVEVRPERGYAVSGGIANGLLSLMFLDGLAEPREMETWNEHAVWSEDAKDTFWN